MNESALCTALWLVGNVLGFLALGLTVFGR